MRNHPCSPAPPPHNHHLASISECRKRKTIEKEAVGSFCIQGTGDDNKLDGKGEGKVVTSHYFNHNYPPGTKVEIASNNFDKTFLPTPSHNHHLASVVERRKRKTMEKDDVGSFCIQGTGNDNKLDRIGKGKVVTSPYFNHNYTPGTRVEISSNNFDKINVVSASGNKVEEGKTRVVWVSDNGKGKEEERQEREVVLVSPYFDNSYPDDKYIVVVKEKTIEKVRYHSTVNPLFSSSPFCPAQREDTNRSINKLNPVLDKKGKGKEEEKQENEVVLVSPYFDHSYSDDKYIVVVKEKANEKVRYHRTANPLSSSSSFFLAQGEGTNISINKFNPFLEAYRRKKDHNYWIPPMSRHQLLQESYYQDPWKVLVICLLLNKTTAHQARRVISDLFTLCPDAETAMKVETEEIEKIICTLGLQKKRSLTIQRFSKEYLTDKWTHVTQLHGIGKYAADAYAIFCTGCWKDVEPDDHKLVKYWAELWKTEALRNQM